MSEETGLSLIEIFHEVVRLVDVSCLDIELWFQLFEESLEANLLANAHCLDIEFVLELIQRVLQN